VTALAIAAFPTEGFDRQDIAAVFRGGYDKLTEAGTALLGGHTVQDPEIKFGYAVTGAVDPKRMFTNAGARAGDVLLLTKPIGTGVVGTAIKAGHASEALVETAAAWMATLNRAAGEAIAAADGVHAATDITGFGLVGHAMEVANASGVTVELQAEAIPLIENVLPLVAGHRSGGMGTNRSHFGPRCRIRPGLRTDLADLLFDPQTSGGLLIAAAADSVEALTERFRVTSVPFWFIGHVRERGDAPILVV
jgi:selenide,water dikinase